MDINCQPNHDLPMWSETRWAGCFNPDQGVGLYLHAGRLRGKLDWWWAQTAIYLPGGRVAVDRSWVRHPADTGVNTPNLDLRVADVGWSARFDGIVELSSSAALARAPGGNSAPSVPARFEVTADGSRPWWDMFALVTTKQDFGDMHVEQMGRCQGSLQVGDEQFRLDGISYYDHSSGVRDWTHFHSHHFALIAMPDYTLHLGQTYTSPTEARKGGGVWFTQDGTQRRISRSEMPRISDVLGNPTEFDWLIKVEGQEMIYRVGVLHTFPSTITFDNDNINGIDWLIPGDPLYPIECQVRVTAPDGAVGYGHIERSTRRSCLV
ncbi:MAG: hypothetical protein RBS40_13765 [Rhodocyclaceae bacterium]|nr:hypothetical protein [Rhodocyclaceae bacterium]